jgi:hypothetical protein
MGGQLVSAQGLERRVEALEAAGGDGGGCERCSGVLVVVSNAVTREFHSATWNGEGMSEVEAREHERRRECPGCGRRLDAEDTPVIWVGGLRGHS